MNKHIAYMVLGATLAVALGLSQGADAKPVQSPGWYLQGSVPREDTARADAISRSADPRSPLTACAGDIAKLCPDLSAAGQRSCLSRQGEKL